MDSNYKAIGRAIKGDSSEDGSEAGGVITEDTLIG